MQTKTKRIMCENLKIKHQIDNIGDEKNRNFPVDMQLTWSLVTGTQSNSICYKNGAEEWNMAN